MYKFYKANYYELVNFCSYWFHLESLKQEMIRHLIFKWVHLMRKKQAWTVKMMFLATFSVKNIY